MFCRNCGKNIPNNTRFCNYCGAAQFIGFEAESGRIYRGRKRFIRLHPL